jgi:hypothetical protein
MRKNVKKDILTNIKKCSVKFLKIEVHFIPPDPDQANSN